MRKLTILIGILFTAGIVITGLFINLQALSSRENRAESAMLRARDQSQPVPDLNDVKCDLMPPGPRPIVRTSPKYPREAREEGLEGCVILAFSITGEGRVADLKVVASSNPVFEKPAADAMAEWRYRRRTVNGKPVKQRGIHVTIKFRLANDGEGSCDPCVG